MAIRVRSLVVLGTFAGGQATTRCGGCRSHVRSLLQLPASDSQARAPQRGGVAPPDLGRCRAVVPGSSQRRRAHARDFASGECPTCRRSTPQAGAGAAAPRRPFLHPNSLAPCKASLGATDTPLRVVVPPPPHGGSPRGQGPAEVTRRPRRGQESGRPG